MSVSHTVEGVLVEGMAAAFRALPRGAARTAGARLGDLVRALGLRAKVARDNLRGAFPEKSPAEREAILVAHYRELGRIVAEYARLDQLAKAPGSEVYAEVRGFEHLERAASAGRGAILLGAHYGNIELSGAWLAQRHHTAMVVQPMGNPRVEAWIAKQRHRAGCEAIAGGTSLRRVYHLLRDNGWVAMLGDQDARHRGVFVPFLGRPASTPLGPARVALATGAPIIMGFTTRRPDGRLELECEPPLPMDDADAPEAAERLTRRHVARLETWIRRYPELWFWLHRRWKTAPKPAARAEVLHASL